MSDKKKHLPCGRPLPTVSGTKKISLEEELEKWRLQLQRYLTQKGLKYSDQRWKIVKLILSEKGHFSAQQIVQKVVDAHPGIGPATVYRNIKLLSEALILRETLADSQGRSVYELFDEDHHDHIVCVDCNQIFEFHDPEIEAQQERVTKKLRFGLLRHRHILYAHCQYKEKR